MQESGDSHLFYYYFKHGSLPVFQDGDSHSVGSDDIWYSLRSDPGAEDTEEQDPEEQ